MLNACGMNTEMRRKMEEGKRVETAVSVHSCSLWETSLSVETTQLSMVHYTILKNTISHEHGGTFGADYDWLPVYVAQQQEMIPTLKETCVVLCVYVCFVDKATIAICDFLWVSVHVSITFIPCFLEVKDIPEFVLGKVAWKKKGAHT